jgi:uncharacterized protein
VLQNPAVPYVGPFAVFFGLLYLFRALPLPDLLGQILFVVLMAAAIYFLSWPVVDLKVRHLFPSLLLGTAVFVLWIGPDLLFPDYRHFWLFDNFIVGKAVGTIPPLAQTQPGVLFFRSVRAVLLVPILEELFWRSWLMRWLIKPNFLEVPLGTYSAEAFWIVAVLFSVQHGPYWDVGLVCGILYNWWMIRTKSLGDLILTHAVTNALLCGYVIAFGKWEYWL